jgi:hypothetical protein
MAAGGSKGGGTTSLAWIRLVTDGTFAKIRFSAGEDVAGVAELACTKFTHWGLNALQVRIHLVAEAGEQPGDKAIEAALAKERLPVSAAVASGAWLVAVPFMPAGSASGFSSGLAAVLEAVETLGAKVDATSSEIAALRLAQEAADDFSFVSPTGKQYEVFVDTKIDAWLAEQCGLEVMAARRGIPQTDEAAFGVQWDARFSVLCPQGWEQPPPSALMYTYGGGQYARPASTGIPPRQILPTKPPAAYFAVLEYTRFPGWTVTWKSENGLVFKSLLFRLEERLLKCIQRAGATGVASTGVLDLVAVVGVVGEDCCQESAEAILSKADSPFRNLREMFLARRCVFFKC